MYDIVWNKLYVSYVWKKKFRGHTAFGVICIAISINVQSNQAWNICLTVWFAEFQCTILVSSRDIFQDGLQI